MTTSTTNRTALEAQVAELEADLMQRKQAIAELRRTIAPEPVDDYQLTGAGGRQLRLSELLGDKEELVVIHNMGRSCSYCTLWADGFNGLLTHIENRAAFVVVSPDEPQVQHDFAASRGWGFTMLSAADSTFTRDLGYQTDDGYLAGVSVLRRADGRGLERVSSASFGPSDSYCVAWDIFDLLPGGHEEWSPRLAYA